MSKLSLNLTKISKESAKISDIKVFFAGKKNGLVRRAEEEKRMDSNYIYLWGYLKIRTIYPQNINRKCLN